MVVGKKLHQYLKKTTKEVNLTYFEENASNKEGGFCIFLAKKNVFFTIPQVLFFFPSFFKFLISFPPKPVTETIFFPFFFVKKPSISWFALLIFFVFSPQNVCQRELFVCVWKTQLKTVILCVKNFRPSDCVTLCQENSSQRPLFLYVWNSRLSDSYFDGAGKFVLASIIFCIKNTWLSNCSFFFVRKTEEGTVFFVNKTSLSDGIF